MTVLLWLAGCVGGTAECGPAECADICAKEQAPAPSPTPGPAPAAAPAMSDFEHKLLDPKLEDLRAGVRPWSDEGIGICRGKKSCDEYLGMEPGELPKVDYLVMAELRVPDIGEKGTWSVTFETDCTSIRTTPNGESRDTRNYNRTYEVFYAGEDRGYRLMPLRTIESPSGSARTECTWTLTAPHPDGDQVYEGSWSTPAEG